MTLTRNSSYQPSRVQPPRNFQQMQVHEDHSAPSTSSTQHSQDKTEKEDTINIHDSYFDDQEEGEYEDNYMKEDEDMMECTVLLEERAAAATSSHRTTPPPSPSSLPGPSFSATHTNTSYSVSGHQGYHDPLGRKRSWFDRKDQANLTKETDGKEIFTKRYRAYNSANTYHRNRSFSRYRDNNSNNERCASTRSRRRDRPVPDESRGDGRGFKDLRHLIDAVTVGSNAHFPTPNDPGSVHSLTTRSASRRRSSPETVDPSRSSRFTHPRLACPDEGEGGGGVRGRDVSGNTALFTEQQAPPPLFFSHCYSNHAGYGGGYGGGGEYTNTFATLSPETLLQLALSELNCLITRHDEERAAHGQTKKGLAFVERRLTDAYQRIRVLNEEYDHVLQRCRRAERSLRLTRQNDAYNDREDASDYDEDDDDDDDGDGDDNEERSSRSDRRRHYSSDMSRSMSRSWSRSRGRDWSRGRAGSRSKGRGRDRTRDRGRSTHRHWNMYRHRSTYRNKSTRRHNSGAHG